MKAPDELVMCAVRGGPESRTTVSHAIDLALARGARLTFLHVMDAEFLGHATHGALSVVYGELVEMGTFAMLILCDRAQRRGVRQVDYLVLEGNVQRQIQRAVREHRPQVLVMGCPTRSPGGNAFSPADLQRFAAELEAAGRVEVVLVNANP